MINASNTMYLSVILSVLINIECIYVCIYESIYTGENEGRDCNYLRNSCRDVIMDLVYKCIDNNAELRRFLTLMQRTGPKISSFQSLLVMGTSTRTVGGMKNPDSCTAGPPTRRALKSALGSPPQRKVRFSSFACAMKLLTRSYWPLLTMGP